MNAKEQLIATKIARLKGMTKTEYYEFLERNAEHPAIEIRETIEDGKVRVKFIDNITLPYTDQGIIQKSGNDMLDCLESICIELATEYGYE